MCDQHYNPLLTFSSVKWGSCSAPPSCLLPPQFDWLPLPLQEKAEALLELRGRLQEAQDTTEALRVQVGTGPRGWEVWGAGKGVSEAEPGKCLLPQ